MRLAVALIGAGILLTGCGSDEPATRTVTVEFRLADADTAFFGCKGAGGYSDIGPGTSVTVRNGKGDVLGVGKLGEGLPSNNGVQVYFCDWTVQIPDVPVDEDFYAVEVADRGEITSSGKDLAADDWIVEVSLGEL